VYEIENLGRYNCMRLTLRAAEQWLREHPDLPPVIRYRGPKPPFPNRNGNRADFILRAADSGHATSWRDYSIDVNWWQTPRP
jgi:hypothetical protein